MSINKILKNKLDNTNGKAKMVKVPQYMRPTSISLKKLEREISAQVIVNEAMRSRSMQNAYKMTK